MIQYVINNKMLFVMLVLVGVFYIWITIESKKNKSATTGDKSAGFSTMSDIKPLCKGQDGFQLSKNVFISSSTCYEHISIFGPTGAGKTTSLFYPNLLQKDSFCNGNSSIVVTDPKSELFRDTSQFQMELGREPMVFAPYDPERSIRYNPVSFCSNVSEVLELARDVLISGTMAIALKKGSKGGGDSEWINMATPLFAASLIYCWKQGRPYNTISNCLKVIIDSEPDDLTVLLGQNDDPTIRDQYRIFLQSAGSEKTASSIKSTFANNLQMYIDPTIQKITEYSTFKFSDFRTSSKILYINYPIEKSADLAPLLSVFYAQMISKCKEVEFVTNSKGEKMKATPMFFLFDEFANVGQIPLFANHASTLRSYRMSLICCLQDKNQLRRLYGEDADTIFNNLKSTVVFGGLKDENTLRAISSLCGKVDVDSTNKSISSRGDVSMSESKKEKDVMSISDIKMMNDDEILIMLKNLRPYIDKQNVFYKQSRYTTKIVERERPII